MEAGQRDELELVAQSRQLVLESRNGRLVELLLPVKRGRTIIGQQLAGICAQDGLSKPSRLVEVGFGSLAPEQVGIRRVSKRAGNRGLKTAADAEKSLPGAITGKEWLVAGID